MKLVYMNGENDTSTVTEIHYVQYSHDKEAAYLSPMRDLISEGLSEPYSIYVYRYFLGEWGDLCFLALDKNDNLIGVVVCKLEPHESSGASRGYVAMLAVQQEHRGKRIATELVKRAIDVMIVKEADEVSLETEVVNTAAIRLYERLGFLKSKRLHRYYLNGNSAYRLLLPLSR